MKEEHYHIALNDYERGVVIRALNGSKAELIHEGKSINTMGDLIIKVGHTPKEKFKVIERKGSSGHESK